MHQIIKCYWLLLLLLISFGAQASHHCSQWLAKVISFQGKVDIQFPENSAWQPVEQDQTFCHGDKIRTSKNSRATLLFTNESRATLDQSSTLILLAPEKKVSSWYLELLKGSSFFRSRESQRLNVHTPFINAVHEGTEFLISVNSEQTEITVFDGQVAATNQQGEIHIKKGYTGIANKSQPPRLQALTIRPEDAVQWTLYYPPIIDYQNSELSKSDLLQPAIKAYQQGDIYQALNQLDNIPTSQQNASYLTLKSSLLLTVGRVDEALTLNNKALVLKPDNSAAFALLSIIAVTKNRQDKAFDLAQKAVTSNPQSAVAQIALSYAYQSQFKIESALKATEEATRLSPDNALAWARLSELQLSTGERSDALESAQKAQQLNPKLERTQTILGFAYLAQVDIDEAKTAFSESINLNSADPLARLGLGLAKIRKGDIEEGTRDLETAVSLDPDNAIMRSYLGKAYYELKNDEFAGTELAIAKEMDPNDPTAWFYDAIRKQTTNRPVEALHDMQKAIELNDNRGVYRSKLLLDEDLAARSASLGRIYNDLGFQQLGLLEGWKSVNAEPSNYSAHRLLADNYSALPRHEIARVSELLQSQLLQPINITPVQPQLAESNLLILDGLGPQSPSFNEFNPLFTQNRFALQTSGVYGSNNTWGDEVTQSGLWNNLSYSLGQFHFETDGFRENNDLKQDIYNVFVQTSITPSINVQSEYRYRKVVNGDLDINFDPDNFSKTNRRTINENTYRLGALFKTSPRSNVIASVYYGNRNTELELSTLTNLIEEDGYIAEAQFRGWTEYVNFQLGGVILKTNVLDIVKTSQTTSSEFNQKQHNIYGYTNVTFPNNFVWILGLSYDSFEEQNLEFTEFNPKVGLQWNITDKLHFRAAAFKTLRRGGIVKQSIEPTQVAGFNQFFDDAIGSKIWRFGVGLDAEIAESLYVGVEASRRKIDAPFSAGTPFFQIEEQQEDFYRGYLFWTPHKNWAFSAEYKFEKFNFKSQSFLPTGRPGKTETTSLPLTGRYFSPNGFFAEFNAIYVYQNVNLAPNLEFKTESDNFWILDASIGFRLPNRHGILSLKVKNLLDEKFFFQDQNFRTGSETNHQFIPDRTILGTVTLNF